MKGIIWYYTNREYGIERLKQLIQEYERIKISCTRKIINSAMCEATFENGDIWRVVPTYESSRGSACNIALIERGTPEREIHEIIMPCIKGYPYRAYNYW